MNTTDALEKELYKTRQALTDLLAEVWLNEKMLRIPSGTHDKCQEEYHKIMKKWAYRKNIGV